MQELPPILQTGKTAVKRFEITRRRLLGNGAAVAGIAGLGSAFPVLTASRAADGAIQLVAETRLHPLAGEDAPRSKLWLYDGRLPGPTLKVRKGERLRVEFTNRLEEATSVHWHGIRIANDMDGVAGLTQKPVESGETFIYDFVAPDAGTYWYHAHNRSWNQVARGLYGALIVDEETPPYDAGHDITLMLDDWRVDENGLLHEASFGAFMDWSHAGRLGNWLTVNGKSVPRFPLNAGEAYRIRLVNASNARVLQLDPETLAGTLIALDGQPLDIPQELGNAPFSIAPAQRADLVVVATPSRPPALVEISGGRLEFAGFDVTGEMPANAPDTVSALPANQLGEPDLANARRISVAMTGGAMASIGEATYKGQPLDRATMREHGQFWALNGVANLTDGPMYSFRLGETVIFELVNQTAFPHAMHVHGHHFRPLEEGNGRVTTGPWRDTLNVEPRTAKSVAFVADNPGKWLLHCHMLEHAAAGMTSWFEVS